MQKLKEAQILPVGCYTFLKTLGCTLKVLSLFRQCNGALEPNVFQLKVYRLLGACEFGNLITMTVHGVLVAASSAKDHLRKEDSVILSARRPFAA